MLGVLLVVIVGVAVVVGGGVWAVRALAAPARPQQAALSTTSKTYRNHQAMARWVDRQLNDDMVRVTISEEDQGTARRLLAEFYDERGGR